VLISTNVFLGQFAPNLPELDNTAEYRVRILDLNSPQPHLASGPGTVQLELAAGGSKFE